MKPFVIAGPCAAESREQVLETAKGLAECGVGIFRAGLWKPRTKPGEFEGVGEKGLEWLREVKEKYGLAIATEVASAAHVRAVLSYDVADYVWLGARTVSSPFAVQDVADALSGSNVGVLVKNPMSPDLELWIGAIERIRLAGLNNIMAIHRGFSAYEKHTYRNNPLWGIPLELKRRLPGIKLLCDPSHIGGMRELIAPLCQQAIDLNFDGFFIESHYRPEEAFSDARQQIEPELLGTILGNLCLKSEGVIAGNLGVYRDKIDEIDGRILELLSERMDLSVKIGRVKIKGNVVLFQSERYAEMLENRIMNGERLGLSKELVGQVFKEIHQESLKKQLELTKKS